MAQRAERKAKSAWGKAQSEKRVAHGAWRSASILKTFGNW